MTPTEEQIERLQARLDNLVRTQIDFQKNVTYIRAELDRLRAVSRTVQPPGPEAEKSDAAPTPPPPRATLRPERPRPRPAQVRPPEEARAPSFEFSPDSAGTGSQARPTDRVAEKVSGFTDQAHSNLEKFIGENLISKVGIVVLVVGVGIGAKYAIDNNLISPLARIVLGYVFGFGLLGIAVRLKPKYHNFSAVLLSGGMAVMYFITYFAYATYQLITQPVAFALMAMLTVFTVSAALLYNRQIIAHFGLVGAYAVPFLLSDDSGRYAFLFSYMAILNTGILAVSIARKWKPIFYTSSIFTWLIFAVWLGDRYTPETHFYLALIFLGVFFAIFYATKLIHAVIHAEKEGVENLVTSLLTATIFFCILFYLSDLRSGVREYTVLFSYLAVASLAILITSFRFFGRVPIFVAYPFTWLIFGAWLLNSYSAAQHFEIAAAFATVFFLIFYGTTLIYRLATDEIGMVETAGLVMTNSFIYYGFGYAILGSREPLDGFLGLFTVAHATFHSVVAHVVNRFRPQAVDVIQMLGILIVTFSTIAIPVQFDGNFVTLIWSVEAAVLFFVGRTRGVSFFEYFSYPVMFLACCSMAADWVRSYGDRMAHTVETAVQPFANGDLVAGLVLVAAFGFIYLVNRDEEHQPVIEPSLVIPLGYVAAAVAMFTLYNAFRMEIGNYFHLQSVLSGRYADSDRFNAVTQIDYSLLFLTIMSAVNMTKVRSVALASANVVLAVFALVVFLGPGLYFLYELRLSYVAHEAFGLFGYSGANVVIRYVSYLLVAAILVALFKYNRSETLGWSVSRHVRELSFETIAYSAVLIISSCDLMNVAAHFRIADADKFGLSILWGVFALALIAIGIARARKHLRIAAIALLGITLAKLFFYDITNLGTIPKTILFVSLGLLLLVVSFLYNKYKNLIFNNEAGITE